MLSHKNIVLTTLLAMYSVFIMILKQATCFFCSFFLLMFFFLLRNGKENKLGAGNKHVIKITIGR